MKDDILAPVRQKLLDENQHRLVRPPQNLEANSVKSDGRAETALLTSVAKTKLQFVTAVPTAIVAGIIAYLGGPKVGEK